MSRVGALGLALGLLVGTGSQALAVVGGEPGGPDAVGSLWEQGAFLCSATLFAPDRAVTAGHCVDHVLLDAPGLSLELGDEVLEVARAVLHPDHWTAAEADLAVLVLDGDALAAPLPLTDELPPVDWDLWLLEATGWGRSEPDLADAGELARTLTARVEDLTDSSLWLESEDGALCHGDSGGAVVEDARLVGVIVGGDPECAGPGEALRVDAFAGFLADPDGAVPGARPFGDDDDPAGEGSGAGDFPANDSRPSDVGCAGGGAALALCLPALFLPGPLRRRRETRHP